MSVDELIERLRVAGRVCVLTGAGVSAESGVPTFRGGGQTAVWKGMPFDEISSARMVRENLAEVWEWFDYRRGLISECLPNDAHRVLSSWQDRFEGFTLVTQNIDGLHAAAGSKRVLELHGNINRARCTGCPTKIDITGRVPHFPDVCPECGAALRPDVVLFGEMLPDGVFEAAETAARTCEVFLIVGTSAVVYPAAGLASIAKVSGAYLAEINPEQTPMSALCDAVFRAKAGEFLKDLSRQQ